MYIISQIFHKNMATFKYIISPRPKKNGTLNIRVRIIQNKKKREISTNLFLSKDEITKSGKIKNQTALDSLEKILKSCREECNRVSIGIMSIDEILKLVEHIIKEKPKESEIFFLDFIKYGRDYSNKLRKEGRSGNAKTYNIALNSFTKFINCETFDISKMTNSLVKNYIEWLKVLSRWFVQILYTY